MSLNGNCCLGPAPPLAPALAKRSEDASDLPIQVWAFLSAIVSISKFWTGVNRRIGLDDFESGTYVHFRSDLDTYRRSDRADRV